MTNFNSFEILKIYYVNEYMLHAATVNFKQLLIKKFFFNNFNTITYT